MALVAFMSLEGDFSARSVTSAAPPILGCGLSVLVEVFIYSSTNSIISNPYASNTHNITRNLSSTTNLTTFIYLSLLIYLSPTRFDQSGGRGSDGDSLLSHPPFGITHKLFPSFLNNTLSCRIVCRQPILEYFILNYICKVNPQSRKNLFHKIKFPYASVVFFHGSGIEKVLISFVSSFRPTSPLAYKVFFILAWLTAPGKLTLSQLTI